MRPVKKLRPVKKPGTLTVIRLTDVAASSPKSGTVWFLENHLYEKVAGPFASEDEAFEALAERAKGDGHQ
jgi:hypothetical protein